MRNYQKIIFIATMSAAFLVACNDKEEVTTAPETAPTEQLDDNPTSPQDETLEGAPFAFSSFSLDVDYGMNKNFDVDYENETTGVEASYKDDVNNENLNGNDAYAKLEPIFKTFTFDASTPNDTVTAEVIKAFGLSEDYQELELEVRFADNSEKEYKVVK